MPYAKSLAKYPDWFFELATVKLPYEIHCENEKKAISLAMRLRYFIRVIEDTDHPQKADFASIIIRHRGPTVKLDHRDYDSDSFAQSIRDAIRAAPRRDGQVDPPLSKDVPHQPLDSEPPAVKFESVETESAIDKWLKG